MRGMKTTTLIYAALLLLAGGALGWTLKGCGSSPAPTVVSRIDTLTIQPDTVRIVARATVLRVDTIVIRPEAPPAFAPFASIDTTVTSAVEIDRSGSVTVADLTERLLVAFTGAPVNRFEITRQPGRITITDTAQTIVQTVEVCPEPSWFDDALSYVVYGLAAVGGLWIALSALSPK